MLTNSRLEEILNQQIDCFLQEAKAAYTLSEHKKRSMMMNSDFPLFHVANENFYEYRSLHWKTEQLIREQLVTPVFIKLLRASDYDVEEVVFKKRTISAYYYKYDNRDFGKDCPISFIVNKKNERVAYRYSEFEDESELNKAIKQYRIDRFEIISWTETSVKSTKVPNATRSKRVPKEKIILLHDFFTEYWNEALYSLYIERVRAAVSLVNNEIGFQSIPSIGSRNLLHLKISLINEIKNTNFRELKYESAGEVKNNGFSLSEENNDRVNSRFVENGLYKALCGAAEFAKCFITAEYLYRVFVNNDYQETGVFDYTAIIAGYLKSVEQLLSLLVRSAYRGSSTLHDVWVVAKKPDQNSRSNRIDPYDNKRQLKKTTRRINDKKRNDMGHLIEFLRYREETWAISEEGKESIIRCLNEFKDSCRNEHFHKDNIISFREVLRIRKNTWICLMYLLGGFKLLSSYPDETSELGIIDYDYERMFDILNEIPRSVQCFLLQTVDLKEIKVVRCIKQETPIYDDRLVSSVAFIIVDDYKMLYDAVRDSRTEQEAIQALYSMGGVDYKIDANNLPQRIWLMLGKDHEDRKLVWDSGVN